MGRMKTWAFALAGLLVALPAGAQQLQWSGEVRTRFQHRDISGGEKPAFTLNRTRIGLARQLNANARLYVQLQDARFWGDEIATTDGSGDAIDFHQAYMEFGHRGSSPLWLRAGRQEASFAEERYIGALNWSNVGRAFDGVRAGLKVGERGIVDVFGFQLREASSPTSLVDQSLVGAWAEFPMGDRSFQVFALHDRDGLNPGTKRTTLGTYYTAPLGEFSYRVEGALQTGDLDGESLSSDMIGVRFTAPLLEGRGDATIWYDRYSGSNLGPDAVPTDAFSGLFGTDHAFFGFADVISQNPAQTQGRGIQDLAVKVNYGVADGRLGVNLHRFLVTDDAGLSAATLADEIDLTYRRGMGQGVSLLGGASYVMAGDGGVELGAVGQDQFFFYLQMRAAF